MPIEYPPTDDGVIVAYSGGKDSLAVLDLAVKRYSRVEPFFMYFIPDLEYTEVVVGYAEKRFGVKVRRYPHWYLSQVLADGCFCDEQPVRVLGIEDIITHARVETGLRWCGLGYRRQESLMQLRWLGPKRGWTGQLNDKRMRWAPIADWSTKYLLAYLRRNRIVIPGFSAGSAYKPSGVDLSTSSLEWMRRNWPRDYQKILEVFPYARAQADRHAVINAVRTAEVARRKPAAGGAATGEPTPAVHLPANSPNNDPERAV